jgi:hypothetical protein
MACDPVADFTVVVYTNAWNLNEGMASLEYQITDLLQGICYRSKSFSITSSESERQNK